MQHTFFQKLILVVVMAFGAACLIHFYRIFIVQADESLNKGYQNTHSISGGR